MLNRFQGLLSLGLTFTACVESQNKLKTVSEHISESECCFLCFITLVIKLYYYSLTKPYPSTMETLSNRRIRNGAIENIGLT